MLVPRRRAAMMGMARLVPSTRAGPAMTRTAALMTTPMNCSKSLVRAKPTTSVLFQSTTLPKLAKNKAKFNEIADKYYVQIRGIHGEHSESAEGIFDISNKRRLGRSEKDLVQDMYDGVKAMIEAEKSL